MQSLSEVVESPSETMERWSEAVEKPSETGKEEVQIALEV